MKIAVLFGGTSSERDVSVASASQVFRALKKRGHDVLPVDLELGVLDEGQAEALFTQTVSSVPPTVKKERKIATELLASSAALGAVDVAFLALHGGKGEDGTIQGLLDLLGIPFTGSDLRGSTLAWDKDLSKRLFRAAGVPTADWLMAAPTDPAKAATLLGFPLVVKPNREGSTVGLTVVREMHALPEALALASACDPEVLIERYIDGRELTVGVLGGEALAIGEIVPLRGTLFDYQSKYQPGGATEIFPADLSPVLTTQIKAHAVAAHRALKLRDYSRVDFRLDAQGDPYALEVNTLPGMTERSLLPQSARAEGLAFETLCERICELALARS